MDTSIIHNFGAMSIGNEIRRARRSLDITQSDLADMVTKHPLNKKEEIKITQKEISALEKGNGNPTMKKLEGIVRVLGKEWKLIDIIENKSA